MRRYEYWIQNIKEHASNTVRYVLFCLEIKLIYAH